ncbi:arabinogalactan oligomer / maltooligosaccharide transport system permease protein [Tessaracoccus bendigoensis DSM 12906]|uniref:Maltose/maltodextrin transport system permease protein n=1 Tax=Tessaracoccus bendigoensis DSM 12906 TaxID=1123357 RepID=A0A1M6II93_9ACTN|nr:ABC transporter permease subunit [Tessaracoccus bendigoensis]SHJ34124.1 arabinogalactan oligomer / maltooligosaccharide transport system permease protein [Tessaracoccus bendigoensis DSM 12906]
MSSTSTETPRRVSHARDFTRPGFYVKLVLMMLVNAFGLYGIMASFGQEKWALLAFLAVTLVVVDFVYFSKRAIPAKYLLPGLIFLILFQVYVMANTAYVAFTNYGDGHNDAKGPAITQIMKTADRRVEGTSTFPVTVLDRNGEIAFAIVEDGEPRIGDAETPLESAGNAVVDGERVVEVPGADVLNLGQIQQRQKEVLDLRVSMTDDPNDGWLRTDNATMAFVAKSLLTYDAQADTFTNQDGKVFHADGERGLFVAEDGSTLTPGWKVVVGFENFQRMFTDSRLSGPFMSSLVWTFAFAILSVLTTFALGLILAVVFNDPRVKGRTFYRAMFILPYAFPGFLAALVWRGLLNRDFGFINQVLLGGVDVNWLGDGNLAKLSIILVNLWLGFPYMFLVTTGALQSIPGELTEAAVVDGAGPLRRFFSITLPLLLVSVAPLLISSFAFNFNNFSLIFMLTGGGPNYPGTPAPIGETDILISMVYAIAFEGGNKQYGLAAAMSITIFFVVGLVSWLGFRQTRKLEEIM